MSDNVIKDVKKEWYNASGNVYNLRNRGYCPENEVYRAIIEEICKRDIATLPLDEDYIIPTAKIHKLYLNDIKLSEGVSVKDAMISAVDTLRNMYFNNATELSEHEKINEYFLRTALCYVVDKEGNSKLLTASDAIIQEIPKTKGINKKCETINKINPHILSCYRLYENESGYFIKVINTNLKDVFVCPMVFIEHFINLILHTAEENTIVMSYVKKYTDNGTRLIDCTNNKLYATKGCIDYLENGSVTHGVIRLIKSNNNKIVALPVQNIVSYGILRHNC